MNMKMIGILISLILFMTIVNAVSVDDGTILSTLDGDFNYTFPVVAIDFDIVGTYSDRVMLNYTNISIIPSSGTGVATVYELSDTLGNFTVVGENQNMNMIFENFSYTDAMVYILEDETLSRTAETVNITFNATSTGKWIYMFDFGHFQIYDDGTAAILRDSDTTTIDESVDMYITSISDDGTTAIINVNSSQNYSTVDLRFQVDLLNTNAVYVKYKENSGETTSFGDDGSCTKAGDEYTCTISDINIDSCSSSNKIVLYNLDYTITSPVDNSYNQKTNDTLAFTFNADHSYNDTFECYLYVNGAIVYHNDSVNDAETTTMYSNGTFSDATYTWNLRCDEVNSSSYTFIIDNTAPTIDAYTITNESDGSLLINYTVSESDPNAVCTFMLYNGGVEDNITGSWNSTTDNPKKCYATVTSDDLTNEGYFIIGSHIVDSNGGSVIGTNQTNFTYVDLYAGYTQVQLDRNMTMRNFSAMHDGITTLHFYSNTNKNFTSYTVGLSTNADTQMYDGDNAFIQVSADTSFLRKLTYDYGTERNVSYTFGWNGASAWNSTTYLNLEQICDEAIDNSSASITHVAWWESTYQRYTSHTCDFAFNNETQVPLGQGYFVRTNTTTTQGRYR